MADDDKNGLMRETDAELYATRQLSSAQTLTSIALVTAPVSLLIGGVLLSVVALICGIVAHSKASSVIERLGEETFSAARLRAQSRIAMAIASFATVVNIVYLIYMMPLLIEFMNTGDPQALLNGLGAAQDAASSSASSVWG